MNGSHKEPLEDVLSRIPPFQFSTVYGSKLLAQARQGTTTRSLQCPGLPDAFRCRAPASLQQAGCDGAAQACWLGSTSAELEALSVRRTAYFQHRVDGKDTVSQSPAGLTAGSSGISAVSSGRSHAAAGGAAQASPSSVTDSILSAAGKNRAAAPSPPTPGRVPTTVQPAALQPQPPSTAPPPAFSKSRPSITMGRVAVSSTTPASISPLTPTASSISFSSSPSRTDSPASLPLALAPKTPLHPSSPTSRAPLHPSPVMQPHAPPSQQPSSSSRGAVPATGASPAAAATIPPRPDKARSPPLASSAPPPKSLPPKQPQQPQGPAPTTTRPAGPIKSFFKNLLSGGKAPR